MCWNKDGSNVAQGIQPLEFIDGSCNRCNAIFTDADVHSLHQHTSTQCLYCFRRNG